MRKSTFLWTAVGVAGLALACSWMWGGALMAHFVDHRAISKAAWVYQASDAAQMARDVDAVVVARFAGTTPGRTVASSREERTLRFELNHFVVEEAFKGARKRSSLTLERVSGRGRPAVIFDHDGGPYREGERYLLFLNKQPGSGFFYLVHDEGRYSIPADGRLRAVGEGKVAARIHGKSLPEVRSFLGQALRGAAPVP